MAAGSLWATGKDVLLSPATKEALLDHFERHFQTASGGSEGQAGWRCRLGRWPGSHGSTTPFEAANGSRTTRLESPWVLWTDGPGLNTPQRVSSSPHQNDGTEASDSKVGRLSPKLAWGHPCPYRSGSREWSAWDIHSVHTLIKH